MTLSVLRSGNRLLAQVAFWALVVCSCAPTPSGDRKPQQRGTAGKQDGASAATAVAEGNEMAQGRLKLTDQEFWTAPGKTEDEVGDALRDEDFMGILIDGPTQVATDKRETLPVLVVRRDTIRKSQTLAFKYRAFVVAVDCDTGRTFVDMAMEQRFPPAEPDPDAEAPPIGTMIERYALDLRDRLHLPWEAGRYRAVLILMDKVSNRIEFELGLEDPSFEDPEVATFLAAQRDLIRPDRVEPMPADTLPNFRKEEGTPEVPEQPGIALAVARVQYIGEGKPLILRGSFRLAADKTHIVRPPADEGVADLLPTPRPTAVVPITLVLTGSETPRPITWRLLVPSYDQLDPAAEAPVVTGSFNLDLSGLGNVNRASQTFFLYAFAGEIMTGPVPMAVLKKGDE